MKVTLLLTLLLLAGCIQREYQHDIADPNGVSHTYWYKFNSVASDASAEDVTVTTKDGTVIRVSGFKQENDSLKVWTPYGMMETTK
jgi:major membrane immunogen (membrane-anchored lipoprotein)